MHIYNVLTKGIQRKPMVKPALKAEGYTPGQFLVFQALMHLKRNFLDIVGNFEKIFECKCNCNNGQLFVINKSQS